MCITNTSKTKIIRQANAHTQKKKNECCKNIGLNIKLNTDYRQMAMDKGAGVALVASPKFICTDAVRLTFPT